MAADLVRPEGNERSHLVAKRGRVHLGLHPAITPRSVIRCGQRADSDGVSWPGGAEAEGGLVSRLHLSVGRMYQGENLAIVYMVGCLSAPSF